jgi:glycosyltransferase involved in cell wall biosynthesis
MTRPSARSITNMRLTIVTTSQRALREGRIVGGAPVVAARQARALERCGAEVALLDLDAGPAGSEERTEHWTLADSNVPVVSFTAPASQTSPYSPASLAAGHAALQHVKEDYLLVQEGWFGTIPVAAKEERRTVVWQPNDYSFLCARSWFLRGDGTRCDMVPEPRKCEACQLKGRSITETAALKALAYMERAGLKRFPKVHSLAKAARERAAGLPRFLAACDLFLAQSSSMGEALAIQKIPASKVLQVDYGVAPPGPDYHQRKAHEIVHFAYIARPSFEKGLHLLLEAWSRLEPEILQKGKLLIYSPLEHAAHFQRKRLERLLSKCRNVEILNVAVSPILDRVYSGIDVAVQPSLWVDHNTQTMLEALARSVPVIVPRHTCFASGIVRDGINGLLPDLAESGSLEQALRSLLTDRNLLAKLKQAPPYSFSDEDWGRTVIEWLSNGPHKGSGND